MAVAVGYEYFIGMPRAHRHAITLESEQAAVPAMPGASYLSESHTEKGFVVSVARAYRGNMNFDEVRTFYDRELSARGWVFEQMSPIRDWGTDYGGKRVTYRKGDYTVNVDYSGDQDHFGWAYSVAFRWD